MIRISVTKRFNPNDLERWKIAAEDQGLNLTEYIEQCCNKAPQRDVVSRLEHLLGMIDDGE